MSNHQWERGTIKLPSAEFARIRKAVEAADRARKERVFAQTQEFWKGLTRKQQTDPDEYTKAVLAFSHRLWNEGGRPATGGWYGRAATTPPNADIAEAVQSKLHDVRWRTPDGAHRGSATPRRVLQDDMAYPTNRSTTFHDGGATLSFDRASSSVTWDVYENNHARESAHATAMARAFFAELEKVRWTRGTGGWLTGNDEYHREAQEAGGGANYVTAGFGPAAAAHPEAWMHTQPYRSSDGVMVRRESFPGQKALERAVRGSARGARSVQGRQPRGVPVGGQFAATSRWETGVTLR